MKPFVKAYPLVAANLLFAMWVVIETVFAGGEPALWLYVPAAAYVSYLIWIYRGKFDSRFFWPDKVGDFAGQFKYTVKMDLYIFRDELPLSTKLKWRLLMFFYNMLFLLPSMYLVVMTDEFAYGTIFIIAMIPFHLILKKKGIMK